MFIGVTLLCGYGWTWMGPGALHVPTELRILATPSVSLGDLVFHLLHPLGIPIARSATVTVIQYVCAVAAVGGCVWLLVTLRRHEVVRSLGLALILIVVGSPTVWPWYLMWGLVLLAATTAQRSKALAAMAAWPCCSSGRAGARVLLGNSYILVSLATVAGIGWLIRGQRWRGSCPDMAPEPRLAASAESFTSPPGPRLAAPTESPSAAPTASLSAAPPMTAELDLSPAAPLVDLGPEVTLTESKPTLARRHCGPAEPGPGPAGSSARW